jgi:RNA polymerase sigma-70 factor (ECF subfamily)
MARPPAGHAHLPWPGRLLISPLDRRRSPGPDDDEDVGEQTADADQAVDDDPVARFLRFYDQALPHVYGYLARRCGPTAVAEDLCAETFLAAVDAVRGPAPPEPSVPWAVTVARNKLVDYWRRMGREERRFEMLSGALPEPADIEFDPDAVDTRRTLDELIPQHRAALTLRYLDDLPVPEVARLLGRTVHATEALLVRARTAFRRAYARTEGRDG